MRSFPSILLALGLFLGFVPVRSQAFELYYSEFWNGTITKTDGLGSSSLFASGLGYPVSLTVDPQGFLYAAGWSSGNIVKYDTHGSGLELATNIYWANGVAVNESGDVYYGSDGNENITRISHWGETTIFCSSLGWINCIAFKENGDLLASANSNIFRINTNGEKVLVYSGSAGLGQFVIDKSGNILCTSYDLGAVLKIDSQGNSSIYSAGLPHPLGIAIDPENNIYVSGQTNKLSRDSGYIKKILTNGNIVDVLLGLDNPSALALKVTPVPPTTTDTFGSGTNQFGIDFVTVGNPGNSNDTTGYGVVPYSYRIGKYTISQNQIDAATRNGQQNVTAGAWSGDQPAANISWYEAAAYVNWLNTSQGYRPAYNLTFTNGAWSMALWPASPDTNGNVAWTLGGTNLFRNARCHYFLPSENEWYKAAYYDPIKNGGAGGYWLYPTGSDTAPTPVANGTAAGTAVYNQTVPAPVSQAGGFSPLGTMGQGGNAWQWLEDTWDGKNNLSTANRARRGHNWGFGRDSLPSSFRDNYSYEPSLKYFDMGFRVASTDDSWLTNGLVAHYPFHGDTDDHSGNGNNGIANNVIYGSNNFGISNSALYFNPTVNSKVIIPNSASLNLAGGFTASMWFKINQPWVYHAESMLYRYANSYPNMM